MCWDMLQIADQGKEADGAFSEHPEGGSEPWTSILFGKCNTSEHQPFRRLLEVKENVLLLNGA